MLLSDKEMIKNVLIDELSEIRDKYGDERRTEIALSKMKLTLKI
jgi:DNA gyrase/topoisomerase IV subunit A